MFVAAAGWGHLGGTRYAKNHAIENRFAVLPAVATGYQV
ncbi:hypothetical protein MMEU_4895 [Mycobacterium marinum str. Europe]|nr:hypothetical protein MMEU_4895 [Mycobacterium marinum str. Europe]